MKNIRVLSAILAGLFLLVFGFKPVSAANFTVQMSNFSFTPASLTIGVGDSVTWTNTSTGNHNSASGDTMCNPSSLWNGGQTGAHSTFKVTFTGFTPGTYTYICTNHCANHGMRATLVITNPVSGNASPSVTITNPASGAVFQAPASVAIQANASDPDGTVTNVQFRVGSAIITNDSTAPFSAVTNGLPAGSYMLSAIATDNGGTKATNSVSIKVNAAPSVAITNPVSGAIFPAPANLLIQASASDTDGTVAGVQFFIGSTLIVNDTSSPYSTSTNAVPAGSYTLTAIATDSDGGKATNLVNITINAAPSVTITNPVNGAIFPAPANITAQAVASDSDGTVTNVQFLLGTNVFGNATAVPFSVTSNGIPAGGYILTAIASDNAGARATNSISLTVSPANVAPFVSITNPVDGASFAAPANLTVQAEATDSDGTVTNVQFLLGTNIFGNATVPPFSAVTNGVPSGGYTLTAIAFDNSGATATNTVGISVNPAAVSPSISLDGPTNGTKFLAPASVPLQASITPGSGTVTNVQLLSGGIPLTSLTSAPYTFTISNLAAGNYAFSAIVLDSLGAGVTSSAANVFVLTNATLRSPRFSNGLFQLTVDGIAGQTYITEGSSNLINWSGVSTNVAPAPTFDITDPSNLFRYYRARQDLF